MMVATTSAMNMSDITTGKSISSLLTTEIQIGTKQRYFAIALSILLIVSGIIMTPFANHPWMPVPGYMTAFGSAMFAINFMLAMLLFSRGVTERNSAVLILGTAYFFVAAILLPLMASFPGGLMPGSIIGTPVSAVWLWSFWHGGFGLFILRFVHEVTRSEENTTSLRREIIITLIIVTILAVIGTVGLPYLPSLFADGHRFFSGNAVIIPWTILAIDFLAAVRLFRLPKKTPEQLWLTVGMLAACFDVWLTFHGTDRFSLGWYVSKLGSLLTSMAVLISLFTDLTMLYKRVFESNILLVAQANQDGLTSLANRRLFDETLETELRRAKRLGAPLSLLMVDVDFFKKFNDRYGHLRGDDCLRKVAQVLQETAKRSGDLAARYGGEEFALVLPDTAAPAAINIATQIHDRLASMGIPHPDTTSGKVGVSIGIYTGIPDAHTLPEAAIHAADKALYAAKNGGRNCARHADDLLTLAC